jgi:hypothetical protein
VNTLVQLREAVRYPVMASVLFSWEEDRIHFEGTGVTRDMSTEGVFVYSMVLPPKNAQIDMEVAFPPLREEAQPVRMHVRGRIVRTESSIFDPAYGGFAVTSESTSLRRGVRNDGRTLLKPSPGRLHHFKANVCSVTTAPKSFNGF